MSYVNYQPGRFLEVIQVESADLLQSLLDLVCLPIIRQPGDLHFSNFRPIFPALVFRFRASLKNLISLFSLHSLFST